MALRISVNIAGTALKVFDSLKNNSRLLDNDFTELTVDGVVMPD